MIDLGKLYNNQISKSLCLELFETENQFFEILNIADDLRKKIIGDTVTYIINANINYTNICSGTCKFCAFKKNKKDKDAYFMIPKDIGIKARNFQKMGATEICLQGGVYEKVNTFYQEEILKSIYKYTNKFGKMIIHGFSPMDIKCGAENAGIDTKTALTILKGAGLDTMPGTAAEILVDSIRTELCPNKIYTREWEKIIKQAHSIDIKTTSTIMYGHIESNKDRVDHLFKIKEIQEETKGFTEFILLPYLNENTEFKKNGILKSSASGILDMKMVAISRILYKKLIQNIQIPWVKLGIKFSQVCLKCGANDFSGSMMEDDISKAAGSNYGTYMTKQMYIESIKQINRNPQQRNTYYEYI